MSTFDTTTMTPEDREELAAASAAADSRNRPTHLIVIAGLLLLVAIIIVLVTFVSSTAAKMAHAESAQTLTSVRTLVAEYEALDEAANDDSNLQVFDPISGILTDLERIARESGIDTTFPTASPTPLTGENIRLQQYVYSGNSAIRDESLEDILTFLANATRQIPGLRLDKIEIRLTTRQNEQWQVNATLARVENAQ